MEKQARWVEDGSFLRLQVSRQAWTCRLALIQKLLGQETADKIAMRAEYDWHRDPSWDPFAKLHGLV